MKIGMIIADEHEFVPVENYSAENGGKEYIFNGEKTLEFNVGSHLVIAHFCNTGKVNSAGATASLIFGKGVETVINFGLSGAMSHVRKGDIVVGTKLLEHDFDLTPLGYKPFKKPQAVDVYEPDKRLFDIVKSVDENVVEGVLVSGDSFIADKEMSQKLVNLCGANCCDMESAAIASVCYKAGVPFISWRGISDDADDVACESYREVQKRDQTDMFELALKVIEQI